MINMLPDTESPYKLFVAAVKRKQKGAERDKLLEYLSEIQECFKEYKLKYEDNKLELIQPCQILFGIKDSLLGLYSPQKSLIKQFRQRFFNRNPQTYNGLCPYCTINSAHTTEHILPKEIFPEFAVNVLNLIPSCGECNSLKGEKVVDNEGKRIILNFYTDRLFTEQFLFLHFHYEDGSLNLHFYLQKPVSMSEEDFSMIKRHFNKLLLLKDHGLGRFDMLATRNLTDLISEYIVQRFQNEEEYFSFTQKQLESCNFMKESYGINHWKVVFRKSAAESNAFKKYIFDQLSGA